MNGINYKAPQICSVQENAAEIICTSNVDDMQYRDGEWDSDLTF